MPAGLQAFSDNGVLKLDYTDRTCKLVAQGEVSLPAWPPSATVQYVSVPGISNDGTWFVSVTEYTLATIEPGRIKLQRLDQFDGDLNNVSYSVVKL